jgi:hypothetical protein
MLLLLFVIVAAATSPVVVTGTANLQRCKSITRNELLPCFTQYVDTNKDNIIDASEVASFLSLNNITASTASIMSICDTNADGAFTMEDWNSPNSCVQSQVIIARTCYICVGAGWS